MKNKRLILMVLALILGLIAIGCLTENRPADVSPAITTPTATQPPAASEDVAKRNRAVPHEFIGLVNPISADEGSIARGQELYQKNCASCHGPDGRGDGEMAMMLEPKPTDLHETQVQNAPDGELFYVITSGIEGTSMPGFKGLSVEDRWNLINYLRTFE